MSFNPVATREQNPPSSAFYKPTFFHLLAIEDESKIVRVKSLLFIQSFAQVFNCDIDRHIV